MTNNCAVPRCGKPVRSRGYCNTHYRRWQRYGDPRAQAPIESKIPGGVGYWSVHQRLKTELGPASAQKCMDCGAPARDWSYDGTDLDERIDPYRGYRYSLDLGRYRPRCRGCHRRATNARTPPRPRSRSVADPDRAVRLYNAGASARGIARLLGTSPVAVYRALHTAEVQMRPKGTRTPPELEPDEPPDQIEPTTKS